MYICEYVRYCNYLIYSQFGKRLFTTASYVTYEEKLVIFEAWVEGINVYSNWKIWIIEMYLEYRIITMDICSRVFCFSVNAELTDEWALNTAPCLLNVELFIWLYSVFCCDKLGEYNTQAAEYKINSTKANLFLHMTNSRVYLTTIYKEFTHLICLDPQSLFSPLLSTRLTLILSKTDLINLQYLSAFNIYRKV